MTDQQPAAAATGAPFVRQPEKPSGTPKLNAALAKARAEMPAIPKTKTANVPTKSGGSYSFDYADIADMMNIVAPILAKNGLALNHELKVINGNLFLVTNLLHESGEERSSIVPVEKPGPRPQDFGSLLTYLRRYAGAAMIGVVTEADDDGNLAQGNDGAKTGAKKSGAKQNSQSGKSGAQSQSQPQSSGESKVGANGPSDAQIKRLYALAKSTKWNESQFKEAMQQLYKIESPKKLGQKEYNQFASILEKLTNEQFLEKFMQGEFIEEPA